MDIDPDQMMVECIPTRMRIRGLLQVANPSLQLLRNSLSF